MEQGSHSHLLQHHPEGAYATLLKLQLMAQEADKANAWSNTEALAADDTIPAHALQQLQVGGLQREEYVLQMHARGAHAPVSRSQSALPVLLHTSVQMPSAACLHGQMLLTVLSPSIQHTSLTRKDVLQKRDSQERPSSWRSGKGPVPRQTSLKEIVTQPVADGKPATWRSRLPWLRSGQKEPKAKV